MQNIKIREISVYHGSKSVDNTQYIEHFAKSGKNVEHFFNDIMGRKTRYLLNSETENSLTMAIQASKDVLKKSNLSGKDIDMIIYSSVLPEFVAPQSSLFIHDAINAKKHCFCHDVNTNCTGMVYSLDTAAKYINTDNKINRVLIVGSDYLNPQVSPDNELCYGQYGDAACAIIVERTDSDSKLLGTIVDVNCSGLQDVRFPKCGFSNIYDATAEDIFAKWEAYNTTWINDVGNNIADLLCQNNLTVSDVSMFCFSQFAYSNIKILRDQLNIPEEKSIYVGDRYGYTGTSSPFIALYESIQEGRVKRGDYIILWTVGAGTIHITSLLKF